MKESSANVEQERNAKANSHAAFTEGAQTTQSTSDRGGEEIESSEIPQQPKDRTHCFCPLLAKSHGEEAAVIFQGLGYKIAKSKKIRNGRKWHYDTLVALERRWPYLRDSGIGGILDRCSRSGEVFKGRFNKWTPDRTNWYSMREDLVKRAMQKGGKLWFDVPAAVKCHSIVAGTLYQNIRYQLLVFLADNEEFTETPYWRINKAALARLLPWSLSTIKRQWQSLIDAGLIVQHPSRSHEYTVANVDDLVVPEEMKKFCDKRTSFKTGSSTEMDNGSSTEMTGSSTELIGSSTEKNGSSTVSNTHYKPFTKTIHKHHSPHASRDVCGVDENAADAAKASAHQDTGYEHCSDTEDVSEQGRLTPRFVPRYKPQSLAELRHLIDVLTPRVSDQEKEVIKGWAQGFALAFVTTELSTADQRQFNAPKDADQLVRALSALAFQTVEEHGLYCGWSEEARDLSFVRELEILTGAFLLFSRKEDEVHAQFATRWSAVWNTYVEIPLLGDQEDASAEDKADSLMHEIDYYNRHGWPTYAGDDVEFFVKPNLALRTSAMAFFQDNPNLLTSDVSRVLCDCIEVLCLSSQPKGFDPLFFSRKGSKPTFLFKHWDTITEELEGAEEMAA